MGASAVVVFYMLAGYVVTNLLEKYFPKNRLFAFYAERLLRIYPLYFIFLMATSIFLYLTNFGPPHLTAYKAFANLTIIPLDYYMFKDTVVVRKSCILDPAWSLGAELQVYAIFPLILRSIRAKWIIGVCSLFVFSLSAIGLCNSDYWGYRLLPGILFVFLTGSALAKSMRFKESADSFDRKFPILCWIWVLFLMLAMTTMVADRLADQTIAVMLGFLIGMPIVQYTSSSSFRIPYDSVFGQLSYGIFLIHMPVAWLYEYLFGTLATGHKPLAFVVSVSIALSACATFTVERMTWSFRKSISKA